MRQLYWDLRSATTRDQYLAYFIRDIPGTFGIMIRRIWYTKRFKRAGVNLTILAGAYIMNPQNIECGDNVSIGIHNYIQAGGGLFLGSDVMMGPYVKIWTQTHNYADYHTPVHSQGYMYAPVTIGNDVWIAANAFIMPGTVIGNKTIIAASSVVGAKKYPDRIILAGYPARKIGERTPSSSVPNAQEP